MKNLKYIITGLVTVVLLAGCGQEQSSKNATTLIKESQKEFAVFRQAVIKDPTLTREKAIKDIKNLLIEMDSNEEAIKKEIAEVKSIAKKKELTQKMERTLGEIREHLVFLDERINETPSKK